MTLKPCSRCRGQTALTAIDAADADSKPLAVAVKAMPVASCDKGHRQFPQADFPRRLLEHLMQEDEAKLPAGEEKGLLIKHYHCASCGAELEPKPDHAHTFSVDVALPELDPFRVELTMPVYKCTACAKEQIHSLKEIRKYTPEALARTFQAAGIPPG